MSLVFDWRQRRDHSGRFGLSLAVAGVVVWLALSVFELKLQEPTTPKRLSASVWLIDSSLERAQGLLARIDEAGPLPGGNVQAKPFPGNLVESKQSQPHSDPLVALQTLLGFEFDTIKWPNRLTPELVTLPASGHATVPLHHGPQVKESPMVMPRRKLRLGSQKQGPAEASSSPAPVVEPRLVPSLYVLTKDEPQYLPTVIPAFTGELESAAAAINWRFVIAVDQAGKVSEVYSLVQANLQAQAALCAWLKKLRFPVGPPRWLGLGVTLANAAP